jgi:four helix bundle protein
MNSYKDLLAWKVGTDLTREVYTLTRQFPSSELYGFTSQMRRASLSIPSNLAEGYYRGSRTEFKRFCHIAFGSAAELETQLIISKHLGLAPDESFNKAILLVGDCLRILNKLCLSFHNHKNSS